ncbi:MAG: ribonuclease HI [Candidatus Eisenbacteria bacterium]|uniref:Ribonuclease H n=1 Tax=Eiseniibacteriota bacterium TaxID=2212470 RepID=A0A948RRY3_UNCEI|nr:ribonuclease HI [Candidatus Eisenbacteria bacterium]MBU1948481.1 ribonuclease HI [Candidatus Eisenbacteria bacterium]MBU2689496.1 ribonuclease HI [Candidatus Eisenbacteria bacterium]
MNLSNDIELRRLLGLSSTPPDPVVLAGEGWATAAFDGGCKPNPGPGGWGALLPDGRELKGGALQTTNNRMELTAAIRLLESTKGPIRLLGDSSYVIRGVTEWLPAWIRRGWLKADGAPVENRDLWERLSQLIKGRPLKWEFVRGHRGHPMNERCDQLATQAREEMMGGG